MLDSQTPPLWAILVVRLAMRIGIWDWDWGAKKAMARARQAGATTARGVASPPDRWR